MKVFDAHHDGPYTQHLHSVAAVVSPGADSYTANMAGPAIVHLIGFPASGKLTVARALAEASSSRFVVLDNHHTNNVIFSALDLDGVKPVPPAVWDRVREVRDALLRTIEGLSPSTWSFVFTNVLTDDKPEDRRAVDDLVALAERTDRSYLPVVLRCGPDAIAARVANPDRRDRSKWIDPSGVLDFVRTHRLVDVTDLRPLIVDTASNDPADAALLILRRIENGSS
jgi:hypothetical protein